MEKICTKCKITKPLTEFHKNCRRCKKCRSEDGRITREKYPERERERSLKSSRKWKEKNREEHNRRNREYAKLHIADKKKTSEKYYQKNKERINKYSLKWASSNKDRVKKRLIIYNKLERVIEKRKAYLKNKRDTNIQFKLVTNLRTRINYAILSKRSRKSNSTTNLLGCTIIELKQYLESKFLPTMTWENYGAWHIDHIVPLSTFDLTDPEQFAKACHYTNLQPLWAEENSRKHDRLDYHSKSA